jgi:hypothetical protein
MIEDRKPTEIIVVGVAAIAYLVMHFTAFISYMLLGVYLTIPVFGFLSAVPFIGTVGLFASPLLAAGTAGVILQSWRIQKPYQTAIAAVALSQTASEVITVYLGRQGWTRAVVGVSTILIFLGTYYAFQKIKPAKLAWTISLVLIVLSVFYQPPIVQQANHTQVTDTQYANQTNDQFAAAVKDLDFQPYYPDYIPPGLTATKPGLFGYRHTGYDNIYVGYRVGKVEIRQSAKLTNQDKVMNFTTNCDVSIVWFAMAAGQSVSDFNLKQSLDNLTKCKVIGKTDAGQNIYKKGADDLQYAFYFMNAGGTNVVIQYDQEVKPRYDATFEQQIIKLLNSMKPLDKSKLIKGII